jgi:hypothetical protein
MADQRGGSGDVVVEEREREREGAGPSWVDTGHLAFVGESREAQQKKEAEP